MSVIAGQVWTPKGDTTPHVVTGLRFDFGKPDFLILAQLVRVAVFGDQPYSFIELDCDALRDTFDLVYDATLIEPYAVNRAAA